MQIDANIWFLMCRTQTNLFHQFDGRNMLKHTSGSVWVGVDGVHRTQESLAFYML